MKVVNFYGGPGSGKSTMAAAVFAELKERGHNCELVTEYAKDLVWQNSLGVLSNQLYVFAKQYHRLWRLRDQVEYVITDAPLLNSLIYDPPSRVFIELVLEQYNSFNNVNIFLNRVKPYNPKGRTQNEEGAMEIDVRTRDMLTANEIMMDMYIDGASASRLEIINTILNHGV